jgi:translation initiation factor IF-2
LFRKKSSQKQRKPAEEAITTQYQKLSGTKLTGQTIDLSQFNKPKKKKRRA